MCSPMIAITIASAAFSAYSQKQAGDQNAAIAKQNAALERRNADISEAAALDATQRGADQAAQVKDRTRRIAASQRAGTAAGGVVTDTGSALDLLTETAGMGELDALTTMNNAQREAYGYKVRAANQTSGADNAMWQSDLAKQRGNSAALGSLMTGGAKAYSQWQG